MNRLTKRYGNGKVTLDAEQFPPVSQEAIDRDVFNSEPIQTAIERLAEYEELHIPTKPNYEGDGYDDDGGLIYDTAYCPKCRHEFEADYKNPRHCPDCAQALDWEVVDDENT